MQCTSCQFHNMPGTAVCGRCGTSLRLATATAIDVRPPRAGRLTKLARRAMPVGRAYHGLREAVGGATDRAAVVLPSPVLSRLLVPGWSHFYLGQQARGHLYLWSFLACLLPGLLLFGTTLGSVLLGFAFGVHSTAALDIATQLLPEANRREYLVRSFAVSAAVGLAVYAPAWWLLTRWADPQLIAMSGEPFERGDVVLVNRRATPVPGRTVLYELTARRFAGQGHRFYEFAGERIDRILAGPGDAARWERGVLFVNGKPSPWRPLNPERVPPARMEFEVPAGQYLILPSTTPGLNAVGGGVETWHALSLVPRENVHGTAWARSHPLSRIQFLE